MSERWETAPVRDEVRKMLWELAEQDRKLGDALMRDSRERDFVSQVMAAHVNHEDILHVARAAARQFREDVLAAEAEDKERRWRREDFGPNGDATTSGFIVEDEAMSEHKLLTDDELAEMQALCEKPEFMLGRHNACDDPDDLVVCEWWVEEICASLRRCIAEVRGRRAEVERLKEGEARACEEALSRLKRTVEATLRTWSAQDETSIQ